MKAGNRVAPSGPLNRIRPFCRSLCVLPFFFGITLPAGGATQEIHRCIQDDGTVAFRETPCPEADPPAAGDSAEEDSIDSEDVDGDDTVASDGFFDFTNPFDEPAEEVPEPEPVPAAPPELPSEDRVVCEQTTREAIDAIEVRMRAGYTREEGQAYLNDLLELTRQLRACKEL